MVLKLKVSMFPQNLFLSDYSLMAVQLKFMDYFSNRKQCYFGQMCG